MIARISGTICEKEDRSVVIDTNGVGYRVYVGVMLLSQIQEGDQIVLYTYHHITDAGQDLYGFQDTREQAYFKLLLTVPTVGAKTARSILDIAPPDVLEQAVVGHDVGLLTKVSGVGKRTAERIVVELHEKIQKTSQAKGAPKSSVQQDAMEALISLGFSTSQARVAVGQLPAEVQTVEEAVKQVLQHHGRR